MLDSIHYGPAFIVTGGIYKDTTFTELESEEEFFGAFTSYDEALEVWRSESFKKVDVCNHKVNIKRMLR